MTILTITAIIITVIGFLYPFLALRADRIRPDVLFLSFLCLLYGGFYLTTVFG